MASTRTSTSEDSLLSPHLPRQFPRPSSNFERLRNVLPKSSPQSTRTRFDQELEDYKRYEDFGTIDWVQDSIRERIHMNALRTQTDSSWRSWVRMSYEASQAWIVVSVVGVVIGLNSSLIAIITEWLSDIKIGYCSTGWWLNQEFCCWAVPNIDDQACEYWSSWSKVVTFGAGDLFVVNWAFYIVWATIFATVCAYLVKSFAPYAAGSGIAEIKCILAGFVMKGFLGASTLLLKSIGLALAVASNLSIGKEGPSVHMACCVGNVISRFFGKYKRNKAKMREILSASSAAGVAVAFGSPIGGVLFSLEEMSSNFPMKTMWRSFFCALIATMTLQAMNPFRTGKLVMFQVTYDRDWHFFEIVFFLVIGVFGGLYGALMIHYNLKIVQLRKKYLLNLAVPEVAILASCTALIAYLNPFLRIDMTQTMAILFRECEGGEDYYGLCQKDQVIHVTLSLLLATVMRILGTVVSYGAKVPCGIFVPSMAIGATFGRMVGLLVKTWQRNYPEFILFASCQPEVPCITPGTYAFLGAAAALSGVMRITVTVVVIMFELTGKVTYILPTMITLMVTKAVGDWFGKGGIADASIQLNGYPFLDKEEHYFGVPVSHVMQTDLAVMVASGKKLEEVETIVNENDYQGFPVVHDRKSMRLLGYIGRSELRYVIEKTKRIRGVTPSALCFFNIDEHGSNTPEGGESDVETDISGDRQTNSVDFGPYIDQTPITVHPKLPLETVMDMFKKMGPRVILIEYAGRLVGLVTIKDVLKYISHKEHSESLIGNLRWWHWGWGFGNGRRTAWTRLDNDIDVPATPTTRIVLDGEVEMDGTSLRSM